MEMQRRSWIKNLSAVLTFSSIGDLLKRIFDPTEHLITGEDGSLSGFVDPWRTSENTPICRIYDAFGQEWDDIVSVNVITGEARQLAFDRFGMPISVFTDVGILEPVVRRVVIPTPVRLVRIIPKPDTT